MPVTLDQTEEASILRIEGEMNIGGAAEFKTLLLQALASAGKVLLDLQQATELDITALQLLWAAQNQARQSGVAFVLGGKLPEPIAAAASEAGLEEFPVPADVN